MMEAVIFCGGKGTRIKSYSAIPKTLLEVNDKPIICHIMELFSQYGINDFILPLGYKGDRIKEYFNSYHINQSNYKLSLADNRIEYSDELKHQWNITFVDTGRETQTGARLKMVEKYITGNQFFVTYGDGMADVNIHHLLAYHNKMKRIATVTGVDYKSDYGIITVKEGVATAFREKPTLSLIINGGFFVFNKSVFQFLSDDPNSRLETSVMKKLTRIDELAVYKHNGFWISIDTYKDLMNARFNMRLLDTENEG